MGLFWCLTSAPPRSAEETHNFQPRPATRHDTRHVKVQSYGNYWQLGWLANLETPRSKKHDNRLIPPHCLHLASCGACLWQLLPYQPQTRHSHQPPRVWSALLAFQNQGHVTALWHLTPASSPNLEVNLCMCVCVKHLIRRKTLTVAHYIL